MLKGYTQFLNKIYIIVTGKVYARPQSKATDIKGSIQRILETEDDPQILAGLQKLMNSYLRQAKVQKQELLLATTRYNNRPANDTRKDWAMEWLVG